MTHEKQIEEMAWNLCDIPTHPSIKSCEQCGNKHCHAMYYAERAYNAGYRKVSEVAREIFEEIASCIDYIEEQLDVIPDAFASLKEDIAVIQKKYDN